MLVTYPLYILRELGKAFGMSLLIYTFVFLALYSGQALREGATMLTVFSLMPRLFPLISPLALPLSVITGILISYGKLSESNEIVGSQASGIHPLWTALPALVVALLCSVITVYLNADILSSSVASIERSLLADRTEILRSRLTKPGSFSFPISSDQALTISKLPSSMGSGGNDGVDFSFYRKPGNGKTAEAVDGWDPAYPYLDDRILSRDHQIQVFEDEKGTMYVQAKFSDGSETMYSGKDVRNFLFKTQDKYVVIPKSGIQFSIKGNRTQYMGIDKLRLMSRDNQKTLVTVNIDENILLNQYIPQFLQILNNSDNNTNPALAHQLENKWLTLNSSDNTHECEIFQKRFEANLKADPEALKRLKSEANALLMKSNFWKKRALWDELTNAIEKMGINLSSKDKATIRRIWGYSNAQKNCEERLLRASAEINVKLVMSFACISFAIIGIPIGLMGKKGSSMLGFVIGCCFAFGFYMVITALHGAVRDGSLPWWGLWMPNLFVLAAGLALWHRCVKTVK